MAIDFPNSPSANQTYTVGATTWTYDGEKWVVTTSGRTGPSAVVVSDTAPSVPSSGTLWYNSTNGKTYAYYTDIDSSQWVEVGNADPTFNTLTTKGDILTRSSSAMTRLGVGTNDYYLTADSSAPEGISWGAAPKVVANSGARPASPYAGQMIYQSDSNIILIYNGSAWVCITPQSAGAENQPSTSSSSFSTLSGDPSVSIQTGTKALVTLSCRNVKLGTLGYCYTGFAISGATTRAASGYETQFITNYYGSGDLGNDRQSHSSFLVTGLNSGINTFTMQHASSGGTNYTVTGRSITVVGIP